MNETIWKYILPIQDRVELRMPAGAEVLSVAEQGGHLCLWARLWPDNQTETRTFYVCGTGNPLDGTEGRFVGTVQMNYFVWHVFEAVQP